MDFFFFFGAAAVVSVDGCLDDKDDEVGNNEEEILVKGSLRCSSENNQDDEERSSPRPAWPASREVVFVMTSVADDGSEKVNMNERMPVQKLKEGTMLTTLPLYCCATCIGWLFWQSFEKKKNKWVVTFETKWWCRLGPHFLPRQPPQLIAFWQNILKRTCVKNYPLNTPCITPFHGCANSKGTRHNRDDKKNEYTNLEMSRHPPKHFEPDFLLRSCF
jgi:hypothetical protein